MVDRAADGRKALLDRGFIDRLPDLGESCASSSFTAARSYHPPLRPVRNSLSLNPYDDDDEEVDRPGGTARNLAEVAETNLDRVKALAAFSYYCLLAATHHLSSRYPEQTALCASPDFEPPP
ncbi:hypothetical protein NUW54_g14267 [Trametes sanguinea]|uniref:Uncharacterized protein n=1 Tax=Trametes sanguinea TaxID=158606 RepID=A0ACC1MFK8_9APHY|nr:hypothetical protein NUW54_g14267 [Trametes sanguinea]